MTAELANALSGYFETLYTLNRDLITLCGLDVIDNSGQYEVYIKNVLQAVPRLIPYVFDKGNEKYFINSSDGLLEFSDQLPYLKSRYEEILRNHLPFLEKAKKIRNKFEHRMHGVRLVAGGSMSGRAAFDMTYEVGGQKVTLTAEEFILFTKDVNSLFSDIQKEVDHFAFENNKIHYPYYRRLLRYDFRDFNKLYESPELHLFGKALFPF